MTTRGNPCLHNPQLDGDAFFWQNGPVGVLLLHGYTATAGEVRLLGEKLRQNGYTVAAPLLPGHGTQPEELNRVRWQDWVTAGQQTLDQLLQTCERVVVGGESMGGVLALALAAQNPQVKAVLLYAPAIALRMTWLDKLKLSLGAAFVSQVARSSLDTPDTWQGYPGLPLKGIRQLLGLQAVTRPLLTKIQQPVLLFQARLDETVAPEAGEIIFSGVSSSIQEHYWLEHSHHTLLLDVELDEVAAKTLTFLQKYV